MSSCRVILLTVSLGALGPLRGQELASRSPFMPPQAATSNAPTVDSPLEFGGYLDTPGEGRLYRILVKDPNRKLAFWVKKDERNTDLDVLVKQHDADQQTLTIEHQGKTLTLAEKKSKVVSSGNPAQAMPPPPQAAPNPSVPNAVTQAVVLNPTPADEARRLEAVAAEVARRRALREQAAQATTPPAAPPQVPQQQAARPLPAPVNRR